MKRGMFKNLQEIEKFLYLHVPKGQLKFPGEGGLIRIKKFLERLDNPQNKLRVVHVAGTSGKGSTAYFTSVILKSQGFKVGLKLSPHILDFRERFQINNRLLSKEKIIRYFNQLGPKIEKFNRESDLGPLTYFEILVSAGFYIFQQEKVDYAVVETGMGGLYDGTNCVSSKNKIVVLTKIGLDHTELLGNTLSKIAFQKAKIIQTGNRVISIQQNSVVEKVINEVAVDNQTAVLLLKNRTNFHQCQAQQGVVFDFRWGGLVLEKVQLNTTATYQIENCSLALAAVSELAARDNFVFKKEKGLRSLAKASFAGRMEVFDYKESKVILDGAHNPQKMVATIDSLKKTYPGRKYAFLVSFKKRKDYQKMLDIILPVAEKIYLTNFNGQRQDSILIPVSTSAMKEYLQKKGFSSYQIVESPTEALRQAVENKVNYIVATGSFYLLASLYPVFKKRKNK
jgi:dihydrofolate synthase/folylpolyglutamate synthase